MDKMDPRSKWSKRDWIIAYVYFEMLQCKPPGKDYMAFYNYCLKHKPVTQSRILKTIKEILKYKKQKIRKIDICISSKIFKLWSRIYRMKSASKNQNKN